MKYLIFLSLLTLSLVACNRSDEAPAQEEQTLDTIPMMIQLVHDCSRLYTAEYKVHKIVTHDDAVKFNGKLMGKAVDINLPMGKRKVAIPINATLKAYIDFSTFSEDNVRREGNKIEVILPAPHVVLTSSSIDHDGIRKYVSLFRSNFSDEELSSYEKQGRKAIIESIPRLGILNVARQSAAKHLIPVISRLGISEEDVIITFVEQEKEKGGLTWFVD